MYEVIFYVDGRSECPMDQFLDRLQPRVRAKVAKWIEKLEEDGPGCQDRSEMLYEGRSGS